MPNPQQPELARARRSDAIVDDAVPTKATRASKRARSETVGPVPEDNAPGHRPEVVPDKPLVPPPAYRMDQTDEHDVLDGETAGGDRVRYPFVFDRPLLALAAPFGVLPMTTSVELDDEELVVRFGPWLLRTDRDNIAGCEVTGPYRPWKVAGPPRLSLRDRGVTFATTTRSGACIRFHEPVAALLPSRGGQLVRHPSATVTVSNPQDLCRRLGG
jgi:hypothetical protein